MLLKYFGNQRAGKLILYTNSEDKKSVSVDDIYQKSEDYGAFGKIVQRRNVFNQNALLKWILMINLLSTDRLSYPVLANVGSDTQFDYTTNSRGIYLETSNKMINGQYEQYGKDLILKHTQCVDREWKIAVPTKYPFIPGFIPQSFCEWQADGKLKRRTRIITTHIKMNFYDKYFKRQRIIIQKRQSEWKEKKVLIVASQLVQNPMIHKWSRFHSLGTENFFLKLSFNIHNLWVPERKTLDRCYNSKCHAKKYNTMYHILFQCTMAQSIWHSLLQMWSNNNDFRTMDSCDTNRKTFETTSKMARIE